MQSYEKDVFLLTFALYIEQYLAMIYRYMVLCVLLGLSAVEAWSGGRVVVVDSITGEPLAKASVFDRNGKPAGMSSDSGELPDLNLSSYPLSVHYIGYLPATVSRPDCGPLVRMREMSLNLPEVTVNVNKREVLYLTGYVREYSTLTTVTDTVMLFREKAVDFMIPTKKAGRSYRGWTSPRLLSSRSYYRFASYYGLDSVSDYYRQHFSWADRVGVIDRVPMPIGLRRKSNAGDTIYGKYGISSLWHRSGESVTLEVDVLADSMNRKWVPDLDAFMHGSVDFNRFDLKISFDDVGESMLMAENISGISCNIDSKGRGWSLFQVFRHDEPFYVNTYSEIYITGREYIPVSRARKLERLSGAALGVDIVPPPQAPPLQPAVRELIARVNAIDHDSQRTALKPDKRYMRTIPKKKEKNTFLNMLKHMWH